MSITEIIEGDGKGGARSGVKTNDGNTWSRVWTCKTTTRAEDATDVLADATFPEVGDAHPNDADAVCRSVRADEGGLVAGGGSTWKVTAEYSSSQIDAEQSTSPLYPTRPAKYNGVSQLEERGVDFDVNGDPIANLAGDPFHPATVKLFATHTLEVEVNLSSFTAISPADYETKVNSSTFKGAAAGTVMCQSVVRSGPFKQGGVTFYTFRFLFAYAPETWNRRHGSVLQSGLRMRKSGAIKSIKNTEGHPITDAVCLKLVDPEAPSGDVVSTTNPAEYTFGPPGGPGYWSLYASTSFSPIDY